MKAKVTPVTQFNNTEHGYEAKLHYTEDLPVKFFIKLREVGCYELDFEEESDEKGYDQVMSLFGGEHDFENKADFLKYARTDVKTALEAVK